MTSIDITTDGTQDRAELQRVYDNVMDTLFSNRMRTPYKVTVDGEVVARLMTAPCQITIVERPSLHIHGLTPHIGLGYRTYKIK